MVGTRIRNFRSHRGMTLKELAKKTELTTSFLSQLERDLVSPSVGSLGKIAEALDTSVGNFFGSEKELIFVKKGTGKKIVHGEEKIFCETLASGLLNIKMQPQFFTLGIGAKLTRELIHFKGEKFGTVLKGKVKLSFDSEKLVMEEEDSIYFSYTQNLRKVTNIGESEAKFLWIVFTLT